MTNFFRKAFDRLRYCGSLALSVKNSSNFDDFYVDCGHVGYIKVVCVIKFPKCN